MPYSQHGDPLCAVLSRFSCVWHYVTPQTVCSLPGSFVNGDLQIRILDWVAITFSKKSSIQSVKTRPGANCGLSHDHLIAKFGLKLKKVGKTTRPFRYDPNQIPFKYTMEVMNRFKGLDLIECLKNYGWSFVTLYKRQWSRPSPRKRNARKQSDCLRRIYK